jgi:hypothetical protein
VRERGAIELGALAVQHPGQQERQQRLIGAGFGASDCASNSAAGAWIITSSE